MSCRLNLALLQSWITRHDRQTLERLSTPASSDPVVMRAFRVLEQREPGQCPRLADVRVGPAPGEGACYQGSSW